MTTLTDDGATRLAEAVMERAVSDWIIAHRRIIVHEKRRDNEFKNVVDELHRVEIELVFRNLIEREKRRIREIERFFIAGLCSSIMEIDGEAFVEVLRTKIKKI